MTSSPAPDAPCYDCATNQTRLDTLDSEFVVLCEAIDALRTRLNTLEAAQRREHRTMHATFNEHQVRLDALETAAAPAGHRHDGGFWITCPFCVDDDLGVCSACNGTRRIWEMPAEAGA